ncbi:MAG TPA: hypothetical protein V6D33_18825 [Cyanophyceae cyanobacterium]
MRNPGLPVLNLVTSQNGVLLDIKLYKIPIQGLGMIGKDTSQR